MNSPAAKLVILMLLTVLLIIVLPFIGMTDIGFSAVFENETSGRIFWNIRVPRVFASFIAGSVLAVCGMMFQSLFRNDLATPYTLGVSSGAALGAVIAIKFISSFSSLLNFSIIQIFSFAGALLTVLLIYFLSATQKRPDTQFLLLAGVAVNFTVSGLILFIQYIATGSESSMMIRWMMGSLDITGFAAVLKMTPALLIVPAAFFLHRELDLMRINSDVAASRGVNLKLAGNIMFFTVSIAVAFIVSQTGPIGFVGLMAPHISRKMVGSLHRHLIPSSILTGGVILLICDTVARTVIAPSEIPVGVITALLGGPFFLLVLIKKKG
jgi:iron complex transport system permease protein